MKPTYISDYLTKKIIVGGIETTRGEFIRDNRAKGVPQILIDRYLQGQDLKLKIQNKAPVLQEENKSI